MGAILLTCTGCGNNQNNNSQPAAKVGFQLEAPADGEEIAVVKTNKGSFKIRFFPEQAPKAVENFKSLSKDGYYDNSIFHRVIKDFMIQGGDPTGTGMGGESKWGKDFEDEFSESLFNITGAVSMANKGPNTNGSQFFINYQEPSSFQGWEQWESMFEMYKSDPIKFNATGNNTINMNKITDEIKNLYEKNGGSPILDGFYSTAKRGHTVFGQVFEGLDTVKNISEVETAGKDNPTEKDKPIEDVKIESITFENYKAK